MNSDSKNLQLLNYYKIISLNKEIIKISNEGIFEMENILKELKSELNNSLEFEQEEIIENIVAANLHLNLCVASKNMAYEHLKQFDFVLN